MPEADKKTCKVVKRAGHTIRQIKRLNVKFRD